MNTKQSSSDIDKILTCLDGMIADTDKAMSTVASLQEAVEESKKSRKRMNKMLFAYLCIAFLTACLTAYTYWDL